MKQVVVLHGGDSYASRKQFLRVLRHMKITRDILKPHRSWKGSLARELGRGWEVLQPPMPNKANARYEEWKIWFDKYRPFIRANAILVGHSLGGIFLAKYLNETTWPKKILALILVAAPYSRTKGIGDFRLRGSLPRLAKQAPRIILFHSQDDPVVPFRESAAYLKALPQATLKPLVKRGHFTQARFPELVRLLKTL